MKSKTVSSLYLFVRVVGADAMHFTLLLVLGWSLIISAKYDSHVSIACKMLVE